MKCPNCGAETYTSIGGKEICPSCGHGASKMHKSLIEKAIQTSADEQTSRAENEPSSSARQARKYCPRCNEWITEPPVDSWKADWAFYSQNLCPRCRNLLQERPKDVPSGREDSPLPQEKQDSISSAVSPTIHTEQPTKMGFSKMSLLTRLLYGDESKAWDKACRKDTAKAYRQFLSRFPSSAYCKAAKRRISEIEAERQVIQDAVYRILPTNVEGQIQFSESKAGYTFHISAHMLKNYSPLDTSPVVKGGYSSHAGLYNYVKQRIVEIYRVVFTSAQTLRLKEVVVECKHGVRHVVIGRTGSGDYATTLYLVAIRDKKAKKHDWTNITDEAIQKIWEVRADIIPSVQFQYGSGWGR